MPLQKINLPINKINFKKCLQLKSVRAILLIVHGDVAQLGEHQVRNLGVEGSNPFVSTIYENAGRCTMVRRPFRLLLL